MVSVAQVLKEGGYLPVTFTPEKTIKIENVWNIENGGKPKKEQVLNSIELHQDKPTLIIGPNGGGKTYTLQTVIAALLMGMKTGHAPAKSVEMPHLNGVFYIGRPESMSANRGKLSSFGMEITAWNKIIDLVRERGESTVVVIDEPLSTTNEEGAGLIYAMAKMLINLGAIVVIATNDDEFVDRCEAHCNLYHMGINEQPDSFAYSYQLTPGRGDSRASGIEVAEKNGLPMNLIKDAFKYRNAYP
jgi:DNA mismatch repair ATPase MutS